VSKINVTGVTVTPTNVSITAGKTSQLTAVTVPANASNQSMTWTSSDESIATVSSTGLVSGVSAGTATITVTTVEGSFKATSTITVSANPSLVIAKKTLTAPVIDGNLSESMWTLDKTVAKVVSGTKNNTETFGLLWDDTYLYVGAKVLDATIITSNANNYDNDGIEIYFDMNNNGGAYDTPDRQFIQVVNSTTIWEQSSRTTGVKSATKLITGGYTIEIAIPWTNFGVTANTATLYGFDIAVDDDDAAPTRDNQVVWVGDANDYNNLSNVGDLQLSTQTVGGTINQSITLNAGWNLISFNVVPTDSSIATVFNGVMPYVTEIKNADAFYNTTGQVIFNSLKSIEQGKAYLVKMKAVSTLTLTGMASTMTATKLQNSLKTGWNLVGCPFQATTAITTAFDITKINSLKNFGGFYIPNATANSLTTIAPNLGYFVNKK